MMPREWPAGLCVTAAMFWWASVNLAVSRERAAMADQVNFRKPVRISQIAASATDSVQAGAELQ